MTTDVRTLFSERDLRSLLEGQEREVTAAIDTIEPNRLLNTSVTDLCEYFQQQYCIAVPMIKEAEIFVEQNEADVDVRRFSDRVVFDRSKPLYVRGTAITFSVPFDGDAWLFKCRPSHFSLNPPWAHVTTDALVFRFELLDHRPKRSRLSLSGNLNKIRTWLGWITEVVRSFGESLP